MPLATDTRPSPGNEATASSKLLLLTKYDAPDDHDHVLSNAFSSIQDIISNPSDNFAHTKLQERVSEGSNQHFEVVSGLLYGILTDSSIAPKLFNFLTSITRDGHAGCLSTLQRLVIERWKKLQDNARIQILWMLRQFIALEVNEAEGLCFCLLRQVAGGDLSHGNVWLASQMLEILRSNHNWLYNNSSLLTTALYTYLRLLSDHALGKNQVLAELKACEISFCIQVLRERFQDCLVIGRDLVRLLQDVASIPEFEPIWRDLLSNPGAFNTPMFEDLAQLYVVRTPSRYLTCRVTFEMETQIRFLLTHVRMGNQRRYQTWFAERFLSTPESESLVCDLIRFICGVVHPTNQILQSDIVPRWAILGWLLKCCKNNHVEANAKLALFFDWFFFMTKTDNIMNIEPAILLMFHSIPKYADMTNSLLEFLFLLVENYDPVRKDLILRGIVASVNTLVGKGVVHSLELLANNQLVMQGLRDKLYVFFPTFCKLDPTSSSRFSAHPPATTLPSVSMPQHHSSEVAEDHAAFSRKTEIHSDKALLNSQSRISADTEVRLKATLDKNESLGTYPKSPTGANVFIPGDKSKALVEISSQALKREPEFVSEICDVSKESSDINMNDESEMVAPIVNEPAAQQYSGAKRKREGLESGETMLQQLLEKLPEAIRASEEKIVISLLEDILKLFTGFEDAEAIQPRSKLKGSQGNNGEKNGKTLRVVSTDSVFSVTGLAQQLADIFSTSDYLLFKPLQKDASELVETEKSEFISSMLLRMYLKSPHPKLRQLFVVWQLQGLPVSARLLCHVSRIAEVFHEYHTLPTNEKLMDSDSSGSTEEKSPDRQLPPYNEKLAAGDWKNRRQRAGSGNTGDGCLDAGNGNGVDPDVDEDLDAEKKLLLSERLMSGCSAGPSKPSNETAPKRYHGIDSHAIKRIFGAVHHSDVVSAFESYDVFLKELYFVWKSSLKAVKVVKREADVERDAASVFDVNRLHELHTKVDGIDDNSYSHSVILVSDLQSCFLWNVHRLISLLPWVFRYLPQLSSGNKHVFKLMLGVLDPATVAAYETRIALREFYVLGSDVRMMKDVVSSVFLSETFEQQWFWQLVAAEAYYWPVLTVISLLSITVSSGRNPQSLSGMACIVKNRIPCLQLLAAVLKMPSFCATTIASVLSAWSFSDSSLLCSLLKDPQLKVHLNGDWRNVHTKNGFDAHDSVHGRSLTARLNGCKLFMSLLEERCNKANVKGDNAMQSHELLTEFKKVCEAYDVDS